MLKAVDREKSLSLLTVVVDRPTLLSTSTTYYSYPDVFKYPSFKCDRGMQREERMNVSL